MAEVEEILYAQRLGGNDQKERTKSVRDISNYFFIKSADQGFTEDDLMKIWKGLYYCMYMADKPLFQENVAEDISSLIKNFQTPEQKQLFFKTALKTFAREWSAMDNFRADKFMMLMRRVLRQAYVCLRESEWNEQEVKATVESLEETIIRPSDNANQVPLGIKYHLVDIVMEELAKIGGKNLPHSVILSFVYPYMKVIAISGQRTYVDHVKKDIFQWLIKQSKLGVQHEEDLDYGEYEEEKMNSDEEDDVEDMDLDPRAGGVDVFLPTLNPSYEKIAFALQSIGGLKEVNSKKRKLVYSLVKDFRKADRGIYPYAPPILKMEKRPFSVPMIRDAVKRVQYHEQELKKKENPNLLGKKRKAKLKLHESVCPTKGLEKPPPPPKADNEATLKPRKNKSKKRNLDTCFDTEKPVLKKKRKMKAKDLPVDAEDAVVKNIESMANAIGLPKTIISVPALPKKKFKKKNDFFCELTEKDFGINSKDHNETPIESLANSDQLSIPVSKVVKQKSKSLKKKNSMEKSVNADIKVPVTPNDKILQQKKSSSKKKKRLNKLKSETSISNINSPASDVSPPISDPWSEQLKEGEFEFEVEKPKLKKKSKSKKGKLMTSLKTDTILAALDTPNNARRLKINLLKNREHELLDYRRVLQNSPAIPYSAEKKPRTSALKQTNSPILIKKSFKKSLKRLR